MRAGPENMEGRSPCRENNDSLPIQIPRCDTHFVQFKEEKLIQLGHFFFWRGTEISFIAKILAADGLRRHVTITLRDKSHYDLILKRNCITSAGWIDFFHQEAEDEFKYQRGNFMELLMCTIMKSGTARNYANTQNGRL